MPSRVLPSSALSSTQHSQEAQTLGRACRCPSPWPTGTGALPWPQTEVTWSLEQPAFRDGHGCVWTGWQWGDTAQQWGTYTKICLAGHGEQPLPHAHSRPPTATSLQSQGKPLIQRDHLGPIPAAVGSPIPVLQPQHPLGSSQPSQSRTWSELMVWFFPWDATQFSCFPPNTISPGLGGAF